MGIVQLFTVLCTKKTGYYGIGSAISCRSRLIDHMNSFNGHRLRSHLHDWIITNGGVSSVNPKGGGHLFLHMIT